VALPVGGAVFALAFADGGYGLTARTTVGIALWISIMVGVAFGVLPRNVPSRRTTVTVALLALFAAWTFASTFWAASPERAFNEFNRVSIFVAILVLAAGLVTPRVIGAWALGLWLAVVAVAVLALASRFFPTVFSASELGVVLPYAESRLSFPIGYWNGLGILASLGLPLSLGVALVSRRIASRAFAVAVVPSLVATLYLTSSRGAVITGAVGLLVFLLATQRRWAAVGALLAAALGSALSVIVLLHRPALVNGPLDTAVAKNQGQSAALLIMLCCVLAGIVFALGERLVGTRFRPHPAVGWTVTVVACAAAVLAALSIHPVARFDAFRQVPVAQARSGDFATAHLLSGSGSGRWQFWQAAVEEFRSAPLHGRGAGSYEAWWAQHASFTYFLKNAHSLYFEVLGELGIVGLLLICGAFGAGLATAISRLRRLHGELRVTLAALTAVFVAFLAGAAIDWIWQLTAIAGVAVAALGAILSEPDHVSPGGGSPRAASDRARIGPGVAVLAVGWVLICAQAIPWLAAGKISDSQAAVRRGDTGAALANALDAKSLQPWAASPYVQLALVAEQRHELSDARRWIASAIHRDSSDWRLWYLAARMQRESGQSAAAARSYAKARSLNPRSPLFSRAP